MNYCLTLCEIHVKLEDLDTEAATLAATINKNLEEWGYDYVH